jgi:uncharacterized protein
MKKINLKQRIKEILSLDSHPGHIAAGFAVGVFIGITPFFGFHTFLAIAAAILFRLNKLTTITGSLINTPLTVLPILMANYRLGEFILGQPYRDVSFKVLDRVHLQEYASALLVGSSLIGLAAALISYFFIYRLAVRFQDKDPGLAALGRVTLITGESLDQNQQEQQP